MITIQTNKKTQILINEAVRCLESLNVPISKNIIFHNCNSNSYFGICKKDRKRNVYTISINDNYNNQFVIETIIHELLHTIEYTCCHKGVWAYWAEYVTNNSAYSIKNDRFLYKGLIKYKNIDYSSILKTLNNNPSLIFNDWPDIAHYACLSKKQKNDITMKLIEYGLKIHSETYRVMFTTNNDVRKELEKNIYLAIMII